MEQNYTLRRAKKSVKRAIKTVVYPLLGKPYDRYKDILRRNWPLEKRINGAMDLFEKKQGYRFDINNPRLFTEKVVWDKLFYHRKDMVRLVDKYLFKEYITESSEKAG